MNFDSIISRYFNNIPIQCKGRKKQKYDNRSPYRITFTGRRKSSHSMPRNPVARKQIRTRLNRN